jgi:hypothetical protein
MAVAVVGPLVPGAVLVLADDSRLQLVQMNAHRKQIHGTWQVRRVAAAIVSAIDGRRTGNDRTTHR